MPDFMDIYMLELESTEVLASDDPTWQPTSVGRNHNRLLDEGRITSGWYLNRPFWDKSRR